jgi:hypothetical protein
MNMEIAGVTVAITGPNSLTLKSPTPFYKPFVQSGSYPEHFDIDVTLDFDHIPDTKNLSKIFDAGEAWSMWQNSNHYLITLPSRSLDGKLRWAAKFNSSAKKVTIYPGDTPAEQTSEGVEIFNPFSYPLDQILLMYFLAQTEGALIHAAGIDINGKGYIFPGKSGAGKTTLSRQFAAKNYSGLLSDDRIVIRKIDSRFMAYGTPWPGEGKIAVNKSVPLNGIFFIIHGKSNIIEEITPAKAFEKLLPVVSVPWYDKEIMLRILSFCENLTSRIPAYALHCTPDTEVVGYFEKFVSM